MSALPTKSKEEFKMKLLKVSFIIAIAVMAIIGISAPSYAFHDGGVARCESCHTMHNSYQQGAMSGQASTTVGAYGTGNPSASAIFLLRGTDQSSTCLNCHEGPTLSSYHVSTPDATITAAANKAPVNRGPGGDFGWLRVATTTSTASPKDRHGHNIVAADFGYNADGVNLTAPGTTYDAAQLNCISCHNPHNSLRRIDENGTQATTGAPIVSSGSYKTSPVATGTAAVGVYRFLRGANAAPKSYPGFNFSATAPDAVVSSSYNRTEAVSDTVVAYGQGMSQWCGNCHGSFYDTAYSSGNSGHGHPTNVALSATILANYNSYVKTGDMSGTQGFSSLVPVEQGSADYTALKSFATNTAGNYQITASAKVLCLSCHRAHASGFESMARFYVAGVITDTAGQYQLASGQTTTLQVQAAYYDRPETVFATYQRTLCNKCHAKD
jgi:nitrate reductase cytochrome c-type subunit